MRLAGHPREEFKVVLGIRVVIGIRRAIGDIGAERDQGVEEFFRPREPGERQQLALRKLARRLKPRMQNRLGESGEPGGNFPLP